MEAHLDARYDSKPSGSEAGPVAAAGGRSLRGLLVLIWQHRWIAAVITILATAGSAGIAWSLPDRYQASALVFPVTDQRGASSIASSLIGQMGGLASLANLSTAADSSREVAIATLQSADLTEQFIQKNNLLPVLYANEWDAAQKKWKSGSAAKIPSLWKAEQFFSKNVRTVVEDRQTGLVSVSVTWTNPRLAAEWANGLVEMTNSYLQNKAIVESERNIAYLQQEASTMRVVDVRTAVYSLMEEQIRKIMLAKGTNEYSLKVVDRALIPERPVSPKRVLWTFTGLFLGLCMSVLIILVIDSVRSIRRGLFGLEARRVI